MRKLLLLLFAFLLAGCSLSPTTPPAPTVTPTPAPRYYEKPEKDVIAALMQQIPEKLALQSYFELPVDGGGILKEFDIIAVSAGTLDQMKVQDWLIDVVWVYHRNASVALYPLVVGVQDGDNYVPYYFRYKGQPARDDYLTYLEEHRILERGRKLYPFVRDFVDLKTDIDWQACGSDTFCQVGRYMQETYNLDHAVVSGVIGVYNPIPEGWILAWKWDSATDSTINLP